MKLKRKGGLTAGIITLSAVALTSVGFAAWVISAGDTAEITGNIAVDTVSDDSHTIVAMYEYSGETLASLTTTSEQSIKFGAPRNTTSDASELSSKWLSTNNTESYESLSATYYVCVLNGAVDAGSLVQTFSESKTYALNALVTYENKIYKCTTAVDTAGAWTDDTNWEVFDPTAYSTTSAYAVGAFVKHSDGIYKCQTAIEESEGHDWNPDEWLIQMPATEFVKAGFAVNEDTQGYTKGTLSDSGLTGLTDYDNGFADAVELDLVKRQKVNISMLGTGTLLTALDTAATSAIGGKTHTWFQVDVTFDWGSLFELTDISNFAESAYEPYDLVKKDGAIYRFKKALDEVNTWNANEWELILPADFSTGSYSVGDKVVYKNTIYQCKTSTSGAWDASKWTSLGAAKNPYVYYNAYISNELIADAHPADPSDPEIAMSVHANRYLTALKGLVDTAGYTFTFKSYANAAEKAAATDFVSNESTNLVVTK